MTAPETDVQRGGCLCGAVRYTVSGPPQIVAHCHCTDCQRLTGSGHSTGAMFPVDRFVLSGTTGEYTLTSAAGNRVTRTFCPTCGSPICGRNTAMEGFVTVMLGTLDDSSGFAPQVVIFARNRKPWDVMDDSIPTFAAQPAWNPGAGAS